MKNRNETAVAMMVSGANCAQSVLSVFCEELGLDKKMAMKLASGFGAGMGRGQEVCGAVSGGILAIGLKHSQTDASDKAAKELVYRLTLELMERFAKDYGSCLCLELLAGCDLKTEFGQILYREKGLAEKVCRPCVRGAVDILEKIL